MSRVRLDDNSKNAISLFPFLAVLLCTMGSLVVILIALSKSAHDQGVKLAEAQAAKAAAAPPVDDALRKKMDAVNAYVAKLAKVRSEAERRLRDDQLVLSHLEDHMRRLQDRLDSLKAAAGEINDLEKEHYDDREQGEREVERLVQLIEDARQAIKRLREEAGNQPRSYAIVPFEGRNGTRRPPVYIECRESEVIIQPEGVTLTAADFFLPMGAGSPLAAAIRAAREYMLKGMTGTAANEEIEPYPLIIVRPDGISAFRQVRHAIEMGGSDFGYELVEADCDLKFPPADPQLATLELQAIELARGRMRMLAAAAPGAMALAQGGGSFAGDYGPADEDDYPQDSGGEESNEDPGVQMRAAPQAPPETLADTPQGQPGATQPPAGEPPRADTPKNLAKSRGKDWALLNSHPGSVPIRRTIQIVVRGDQLAVLPEPGVNAGPGATGRQIQLKGATAESVDELVGVIQQRIQDWGIAGYQLHWRPVLELKVGPDGDRRADDLTRLLKNSGIDLQSNSVANQPEGTRGRATR